VGAYCCTLLLYLLQIVGLCFRVSSLTCGAKGTRTPDPLLANRRQGIHRSPSPQLTLLERAPESVQIRACCCTSVLYFWAFSGRSVVPIVEAGRSGGRESRCGGRRPLRVWEGGVAGCQESGLGSAQDQLDRSPPWGALPLREPSSMTDDEIRGLRGRQPESPRPVSGRGQYPPLPWARAARPGGDGGTSRPARQPYAGPVDRYPHQKPGRSCQGSATAGNIWRPR